MNEAEEVLQAVVTALQRYEETMRDFDTRARERRAEDGNNLLEMFTTLEERIKSVEDKFGDLTRELERVTLAVHQATHARLEAKDALTEAAKRLAEVFT